jgi:hypothetical protein
MANNKKYYYRPLSIEEGRIYLINAFRHGALLTLWEAGNVEKKINIKFSFADNNANSLRIIIDEEHIPREWKHASLLYHIVDSSFSFLGKTLSENVEGKQVLTFDPKVFILEKRQFVRVDVWGKYSYYLRIRFINPPIFLSERKDNVIPIAGEKDPSKIWMSFLEFVKKIAPAHESTNEVYVNFPIIDLSPSGVAIPVTEAESQYLSTMKQVENSASIHFSNEVIEIPRLQFVHITPWSFPKSDYKLKAGFHFSDDMWVRRQIEMKLKVHQEGVENEFDRFLK